MANSLLITEPFPRVRIHRFMGFKLSGGHKEGFRILIFEPVSIRKFKEDFSVFNVMYGKPEEEGPCRSRPQNENFAVGLDHNPLVEEFRIFLF